MKLTIIGDGPERHKLRAMIFNQELEGTVTLSGALPNDEVRTMLMEASLFVLPCRVVEDGDRDGIPAALMEAMACGVPVVSGDLPAIRELVVPGVTGVLVKPGDANELSWAMEHLFKNPKERAQLAVQARKHVVAEFSLDKNHRRLKQAFLDCIGGGDSTETPTNLSAEFQPS